MRKIVIMLMLIGFLSSCSKEETEIQEFVHGEVVVGIKSGTSIKDVFNFINQVELEVDNVNSLSFTSDLPSDKLHAILDNLNNKQYTHDGVNWFVTGYLHHQTNQIWIFPRLFEMNNIDYQQDWLSSMVEFQLSDLHNVDLNSGIIRFKVPEGQELEWKNKFEKYDKVDWAELNYRVEIELYPN